MTKHHHKIKYEKRVMISSALFLSAIIGISFFTSGILFKNVFAEDMITMVSSRMIRVGQSEVNTSVSCENGILRVDVEWTPVTAASFYALLRKSPDSSAWVEISSKQKSNNYTDTNFPKGPGVYEYQMKVVTGFGKNGFSQIGSADVPSCAASEVPLPPAAPEPDTENPPPPPTETPSIPNPPLPPESEPEESPSPPPPTTPPPPPAPALSPTPTPPADSVLNFPSKEWGAYVGWREGDLAAFETTVGQSVEYQTLFAHWGNNNQFPFYIANELKREGKILLIFWEATNYNIASPDQGNFSYDAILAGTWDAYIQKFAQDAKAYNYPVIIAPFSEMNGNWFPWGGTVNGNTPAKHIAAFRHVQRFFADAPHVSIAWVPNQVSVPNTTENAIEKYYPGDAYVDYVGLDGFNFGAPWLSFDQLFGAPLKKLQAYKKPIFIFSFASAEGAQKSAWITDALTVQIQKYPEIKGWMWFNENKERDWRVNSDPQALAAFKNALP